ncbi:MAG: ATP-binding protein [Bacteroidales bacterium]|nr:ATP-binding protein [Bacteroidales bacterium]MDZ4205003.1 ATP-binding protein [Bacteroidales bacterium]
MFVPRVLSVKLQQAAQQFPVLFLTGPRQSGKTTLLKQTFPDYRYVNLEDPEMRAWALEQPKDFLQVNSWPVIIDEAQYAPELFSYIQLITDNHQKAGMFLLSGSQNFLLMEKITQSLAGRSAILNLFPLSYTELAGAGIDDETNIMILKGFFPRIYQSIDEVSLFYKSYINTYVERDVRQLANIGNLNDFVRFIKLCAGRTGQLLNLSSLATEAGIAYNTCKSWLSWLSAGFVLQLVQPHYKNFNKKIVKAPKIYFNDTGLLCNLLGINSTETLALHPLRGSIFENLIYIELIKQRMNSAKDSNIWFWRDNHGTEIDFILEEALTLTAIDVKPGMNFHDAYLKNLLLFKKYNPDVGKLFLVYDGQLSREKNDISIINWKRFMAMLYEQVV